MQDVLKDFRSYFELKPNAKEKRLCEFEGCFVSNWSMPPLETLSFFLSVRSRQIS